MEVVTPISDGILDQLGVGDTIYISGKIFCGRDAVLPKIVSLVQEERLEDYGIVLQGGVVFHTAVSPAGIGPTTSNKLEIAGSIPVLSQAGIKIHLGKGALGPEMVRSLQEYHAIFVVTPPVTALFSDNTLDQKVVAFPELGMEAFYEVTVKNLPGIVAIAHGQSIF
ncbi:fumarate hydratase C-terminal domain-containing protein [Candidatus Formimonas warabiya]|uniref:Fumarate hydratase n=1 Tax=Formimonas warabiya TaxID=1761012 RepID=A0A3G1KR79_FORW1|nr:fumarate hydratase C-terminal domain-containing protein [Candidatus Formimonas warabiya]ATW24973.1 fumarate hydratase [Candidatus Formimonas warabiya]